MADHLPGETWFTLAKSIRRNLCRSRIRKLAIERLENRQLMAADLAVDTEQPIEPVMVKIDHPAIACIDVAPSEGGVSIEDAITARSLLLRGPSPETVSFEELESIQVPELDWEQQRPLTPEEQAYYQKQWVPYELYSQRLEQRREDLELIHNLDPQPYFRTIGRQLGGDSCLPHLFHGDRRELLRIGDTIYFQTIRQDGTGDIGVYDGQTVKYLGLNTKLGMVTGYFGEPTYNWKDLPGQFTEYQGKLFFVASTPESGCELFSYDGEHIQLYDLTPGEASSNPKAISGQGLFSLTVVGGDFNLRPPFTVVEEMLYFQIDGPEGNELVRFDGSQWSSTTLPEGLYLVSDELLDGSRLLKTHNGDWPNRQETAYILDAQGLRRIGGDDIKVQSTNVIDGQLYLLGQTDDFGTELYRWNGTEVEVLDLTLGAESTVGLPDYFVGWTLYKDAQGHTIIRSEIGDKDFIEAPLHFIQHGQYIEFDGTHASVVRFATKTQVGAAPEHKLISRTELGERSFQATGLASIEIEFAERDSDISVLELGGNHVVSPEEGINKVVEWPTLPSPEFNATDPIAPPVIEETLETPEAPLPETKEEPSNAPPTSPLMLIDIPATESQEAPEEDTSEFEESTELLDAVLTSLNMSLIDNTVIDPFVSHSGDDEGSSDDDLFAEEITAENLLGDSV